MALGASIRGWQHYRPIIVVNGTYLNGHYGGTIFTACTQDANNGIFVLAFGVGDNENDKSWRLFLEKLKNAYGYREGLCFVSNRHGSIKKAIEQVYSESCHEEFEYNMQQLDAMNDKIRDYLDEVGPKKWSQIHMPANRHSTMTSNIVESVNAVTKVSPSNQTMFSVSDERSTFVVDIEQRTCICRMLQVDLMPCPHALAVIVLTKRDVYSYCSYYYTNDAYVNAYESSVYPVGNPDEWRVPDEVEFQIVLAPN
ncbi:uncharacterized protein LOC111394994 [Olea europaea var. sylvestris]|uniref:uncharacterized protein LOC111394994 n=1 Tax=Olea europaea var. sylvestris TaxID=158386 RepID=UPI000C1D39FA|nr:uncharacterized protein LOC111394994 [Olea europaea var. sylvestris]